MHVVEEGERPREGDGLIVVEKGVSGVIKTADCLPVILYAGDGRDRGRGPRGLAGDRGQGITGKAMRLMIAMGRRTRSSWGRSSARA